MVYLVNEGDKLEGGHVSGKVGHLGVDLGLAHVGFIKPKCCHLRMNKEYIEQDAQAR
jgi:hypothetical protein